MMKPPHSSRTAIALHHANCHQNRIRRVEGEQIALRSTSAGRLSHAVVRSCSVSGISCPSLRLAARHGADAQASNRLPRFSAKAWHQALPGGGHNSPSAKLFRGGPGTDSPAALRDHGTCAWPRSSDKQGSTSTLIAFSTCEAPATHLSIKGARGGSRGRHQRPAALRATWPCAVRALSVSVRRGRGVPEG